MVGCLTIELIPVSMVLTDASTSKESLATRAVPRGDGSIADVTRVFGLGNKDVGETCGCGRRSAFNSVRSLWGQDNDMVNTSPVFASQSCSNRSTGSRVGVGDQSLVWRASVITIALDRPLGGGRRWDWMHHHWCCRCYLVSDGRGWGVCVGFWQGMSGGAKCTYLPLSPLTTLTHRQLYARVKPLSLPCVTDCPIASHHSSRNEWHQTSSWQNGPQYDLMPK